LRQEEVVKLIPSFLLALSLAAGPPAATAEAGADSLMTLDEMSREQIHVFLKGYTGDWDKLVSDQEKGLPPPPIQKAYPAGAELIELAPVDELSVGDVSLKKMIGQRRSRRKFTGEYLTNEELSFLLWSTQGISKISMRSDGRVAYHLRTVPSGGARHPFETYLLVNRVEGIKPGIYRYIPVGHKLLFIRGGEDLGIAINEICFDQKFVGQGAVIFIWAAVPYRTEWRYSAVAHKDIAIEAGHICQNLYLAAESIGGGACAILGYDQTSIDEFVGVDGEEEFVVYLSPVGKIEEDK
jgi:SagB-type dehydrogenase family enzyme